MRLHHLRARAFGPFPGEVEVDFDVLNDAGLFLLAGPTGAGKTSVLDAICFALYGSVPGARGVKALRCHHAPPEVPPEVVLEFSVRSRRLRIRRTPEWRRPKKRGAGDTLEPASVSLTETTGSTEHFLSSRAQEVGHEIAGLVGMNATQFAQVAMLPQGEFATFLRAGSEERHSVLEQLFASERFHRIETWVHEHSRTLSESSREQEQHVRRALNAMADRAEVPLPPLLDDVELAVAQDRDLLAPWADALLDEVRGTLTRLRAEARRAEGRTATERDRHERATRADDARERRDRAAQQLADLGTEQEQRERRARLDADTRAGRCTAVLEMLDRAEADLATASQRRETSLAALRDLAHAADGEDRSWARPLRADPLDTEAVEEARQELRARLARLRELAPAEASLQTRRADLAALEERLARARDQRAEAERRRGELPTTREQVRALRDAAAEQAQRRHGLTVDLDGATARREAAGQLEAARAEVDRCEEAHRDARDRAADARERAQDALARRLAGYAAELAGSLAPGTACAVCGAIEHPRPAQPAGDAVSEQHQQALAAEEEARRDDLVRVSEERTEARGRLHRLQEHSGGWTWAEAERRVRDLAAELDAAERAERDRAAAVTRLEELEGEQARLEQRWQAAVGEVSELERRTAAERAAVESLRAELAAELGVDTVDQPGGHSAGFAGATVAASLSRLEPAPDVLDAAATALAGHVHVSERVDDLRRQASAQARRQRFASARQARAAVLSPGQRHDLESADRAHTEATVRWHSVLEDSETSEAAARGEDPRLTGPALEAWEAYERECAQRVHAEEQLLVSLTRHRESLARALECWAPRREEARTAAAMAELVRGRGGDNHRQMRLSAYVLATRLDQVTAAANERLAHMRDRRYVLRRTGTAARKGSRAGLGLEVLDEWNGVCRDPGTLSGGETFVVALCLALGLADVVTHEAGGVEIETLFIDEGFGMLDPDTLDDVMDRLDDLRAGGRTVGVVSHVRDVRERIPTQIQVRKEHTGSSLDARTVVG